MERRKHLSVYAAASWAIIFLVHSPGFAITTIFSDGNFSSGWQSERVVLDDPLVGGPNPGTSTAGINRRSSGGNGGAFFESTIQVIYGDAVYSIGLNTAAVYSPATQGAIESIDYAVDLVHPSLGSTAWQLFVRQDSTNYYSIPITGFAQDADWNSFGLEDLTESDFDTNPLVGFGGEIADGNSPDFSLSGSSLTFGYALGNTLPTPGLFTNTPGIDNWSVSIEAVAAPGDFDLDGDVDGSDFLKWQRDDGTLAGLAAWEMNYGLGVPLQATIGEAVPEPAALATAFLGTLLGICCRSLGRRSFATNELV